MNKSTDPELFHALPWSYGTLGFLTSVTARIARVKPYVKVTYIPTYSAEELRTKMLEIARLGEDGPYFLEATAYSKDTAVIQVGDFVDEEEIRTAGELNRVNGINWWWKPFYYKWVETFLEKGVDYEYIPLKHYYHRFSRSIFWELEDMIPFSNHPIYRIFWGWLGAPEVSLLKLFQGPVLRKAAIYAHVVQESIMPLQLLDEGLEKFEGWFGAYPLLVFPMRIFDRDELSGFLHPRKDLLEKGKDWGLWVDLGAYGVPRDVRVGKPWDPKVNVREMEHWTRDIGGFQACYTDLFCTPKEFRQMFDHSLWEKCREKYNANDAFPEPFEKVRSEPGLIDLSAEIEQERREEEERKLIASTSSSVTDTSMASPSSPARPATRGRRSASPARKSSPSRSRASTSRSPARRR